MGFPLSVFVSKNILYSMFSQTQPLGKEGKLKFFYMEFITTLRSTVLRGPSVLPKTTESRSFIMNTFHNVVEKRNPYQSKHRRRRPGPSRRRFCVHRTICHIYQGQ
jgi:hypothetical protein